MFAKHPGKSSIARNFFCGLLLLFTLMPCLASASAPVAMVTDVKGAARLKLNSQTASLTVLTYLEPESEIELEKGAHVVMTYFAPSAEYIFNGPARIVIKADKATAITGKVEMRKLDNEKSAPVQKFIQSGRVTQATFAMRSISNIKIELQSPRNSKIGSATPSFRWEAIEDAAKYQLTLTDDLGVVVSAESVETNSWQTPATISLRRGVPYSWKVTVTMKSGETYVSSPVSFTVADEEAIKRIEAGRPKSGASFSDRVRYAIYLETEGFRETASGIWQELGAERPDDENLKKRAIQ
jgi:hypothetical protein